MRKITLQSAAFLALLLAALSVRAQVHSTEQIEVELIAETTNVVPGETLWLAVRLDPIEHWHTYWKFGGDSGEATAASEWQLPAGAAAGDILWPVPEWTPFEGTSLVTFAYEREVFLPIPVSVPADFRGDSFSLSTKIDYQVCDVICIPGDATFALTLPVADRLQTDPRWVTAFAETRASLPIADHGLAARFNTHDGKVNIMVSAAEALFDGAEDVYFFTEQGRIMKYAPFRENMIEESRLQISFEQHRRIPEDLSVFRGLLAVIDAEGNTRSFEIAPTRTEVAWNNRIEVELLAETTSLVPGENHWVAVRLQADEGWHTYWKMAGDSGEATEAVDWSAPEGTLIGDIQWPAPYWLPFPGSDLVNYGYEGEVILPLQVQLPATLDTDEVTLSTTVKWYVCELLCIPGEQRLDLTLPIAQVTELDAVDGSLIADALTRLPETEHAIEFLIAAAGERVSLGFQSPQPLFDNVADAWFFPDRRRVIANGPLRDVSVQPTMLQITHEQPRRMLEDLSEIYGTLVVQDQAGNRRAYDFVDPAADANQYSLAPLAAAASGAESQGPSAPLAIVGFMLAALAGGLILNLMPCVFPVLSLKALTIAGNAGATARKQRLDGLVYTGGVLVSFLLLATILIALRAGGELVGWGFQLQEPWFNALIIYLFFMMGLSLSGVFEFGTSLMNAGSDLAEHSHGYRRSFFTGVLAVIVATPCTAPFMGPALGFALTQPWLVAMLVFSALGLGMALPILMLSFLPGLVRFMPKPGNWMVTFKEFMAFPLYVTALYFLWVLGTQVGVTGMALVLVSCILLAFALWLTRKTRSAVPFWRYGYRGLATACLLLALLVLQSPFLKPLQAPTLASGGGEDAGQSGFEPFSTQRLNELQSEGRPVFVNMTAAWCITCLANEQTTLSTDAVQAAMAEYDITYMKGDWTNEDPEITQVLNNFNRPSVPLYVLYSGDPDTEPRILPQILTPSTMLDAFAEL
jgi:thiol:disulfide interchange protein DsbD